MVTYEDLQRANATIKTVDIKGKAYAEVPQRIKAFRMLYPQGFIRTQMLANMEGVAVFKAWVGFVGDNGQEIILGEGTAQEKESSSFINKTSYIENCETSAVGRALGMAGFGIDTSVASAEEVQTAILNQTDTPKVYHCADCGKEITGYKTAKGKYYTPADIVKKTEDSYGVALCSDCATARGKQAVENFGKGIL